MRDCICNSRPPVALVRIISAVVSSVSVSQNPTTAPLSQLSLSFTAPETLEPTLLPPVSACTDYVVIAEPIGQLNFHYLNDCDTAIIAINALALRRPLPVIYY